MNETLEAKLERLRTEPTIYIVTEIEHKTCKHGKIHEIQLPPFLDPKSYQPGISIEAFRNGKRKGASQRDAAVYRDRCCWGPTCLYLVKKLSEWTQDIEMNLEVRAEMLKKFPNVPEANDPRTQPRIRHESVWDFYKAIGFDHELRGYRDKNDKEIRYSVIQPKKAPELDGPGME
jgi:hypothetical protein